MLQDIFQSVLFFLLLLGCLEIGFQIGKRRLASQKDPKTTGQNVLSGSIYALLTLLLSFSFSLAVQRFEARRHLVVDVANSIGTAYLRIDLLPQNYQPGLRHEFERFTDAQIALGRDLATGTDYKAQLAIIDSSEQRIWDLAMTAYQDDPHESSRILFTPAINQMFDLASSRREASEIKTPFLIFILLACLSFASAILAGRNMVGNPSRGLGHRVVFCGVLAFVLFVVTDLDNPRQGSIRIDHADELLMDLRKSMESRG